MTVIVATVITPVVIPVFSISFMVPPVPVVVSKVE